MKTTPPTNIHDHYHAHVYFDRHTLMQATVLCQEAGNRFHVAMGRVHQKLVGPHPCWSCQLKFTAQEFDALIPWLEQNRQGLSILVHGLTGDDLIDHTRHAMWLGKPAPLNLAMFD